MNKFQSNKAFLVNTNPFGWGVDEEERISREECRVSGLALETDLISGRTVLEVSAPDPERVDVRHLAQVREGGLVTLKSLVARSADEYYARIAGTVGSPLVSSFLTAAGESDEARRAAGMYGGMSDYRQFVRRLRLEIAEVAVVAQFFADLPRRLDEDAKLGIEPASPRWVPKLHARR